MQPRAETRRAGRLTPYTFEHATPDTLDESIAFRDIQNPEDFRARLADGRLTYGGLRQMRSGRGLGLRRESGHLSQCPT